MLTYKFENDSNLPKTLETLSKIVTNSDAEIANIKNIDHYIICEISGMTNKNGNKNSFKEDNELLYEVFKNAVFVNIVPSKVSLDFKLNIRGKAKEVNYAKNFYDEATLNCLNEEKQNKLNIHYLNNKKLLNEIFKLSK